MKIIATTFAGLEEILKTEIEKLEAENIQTLKRSVSFEGNLHTLYKANYTLRTALKILTPIYDFEFENEQEFYQNIFEHQWENKFDVKKTLAIDTVIFSSIFKNTHYAALKAKDAIVDRFKDKFNHRPNIDIKNADIRINLYIKNNYCNVSMDSSGDALFKRNYRQKHGLAPVNEVLAAGLIQLSEWDKKTEFLDFMCGSGTLPIEATLYGLNIPAQIYRKNFAFKNWTNYNPKLWQETIETENNKQALNKINIFASDISARAIDETTENIVNAKLSPYINIQKRPFDKVHFKSPKHILCNPPYDKRISAKKQNINDFYKKIGNTLKRNFLGSNAWIFSGNLNAIKHIGLKSSKRIILYNGPIESRLIKYELY